MLIVCNECGKEISDAAASCPQCGLPRAIRASENYASSDEQHEKESPMPAQSKNANLPDYPGYEKPGTHGTVAGKSGSKPADGVKVSALLGLGIVLMPYIFAWFTLRKGYSTMARAVAFGWMTLALLWLGGSDHRSKTSANRSTERTDASSQEVDQQEIVLEISASQLVHDYYANEIAADQKYKGRRYAITGIVDSIAKDILDTMYITLGSGAQFEFQKVQAFFDDEMASGVATVQAGQRLTVICTIDGRMMNVLVRECEFAP